MARLSRAEVFDPSEIAVIHVIGSVVRACYLLGEDPATGKNYDHRKRWIEVALERSAAYFGIDLIAYGLMSTHIHLVLRSRPDVVQTWDNTEVARRWLMLCPIRKNKDGTPKEPSAPELNKICNDAKRLNELRSRLSDISWWMRLMCQKISVRANKEDGARGDFWQSRYRAIRLLDEAAILACAAYVDLNPIRAAMAETVEDSLFTSAQRRVQALLREVEQCQTSSNENPENEEPNATDTTTSPDAFLAPVFVDIRAVVAPTEEVCGTNAQQPASESNPIGTAQERGQLTDKLQAAVHAMSIGHVGPMPSDNGNRCSDKGFASMSTAEYLQLLDWTARQIVPGKRGSTPMETPPIFARLQISAEAWCEIVSNFGEYFFLVAGQPETVDDYRSRTRGHRFRLKPSTRELFAQST